MMKPLTISVFSTMIGCLMSCFSSVVIARPTSLLGDDRTWQPIASDGVEVKVSREQGSDGQPALRIDYDFTAGAGYCGATLDLPLILPENYDLTFHVRGTGPANNLELKLADPSLLNVWWINRRAFEWPTESTRLANQKRHFHFAWGPSGGEALTQLGRIEVIIAAAEGGSGTVWVEGFNLAPLPPEQPYTGTPRVFASSGALSNEELQNLLEDGVTWTAAGDDPSPSLSIDFGQPRDLGGLVIHKAAEHAPSDFTVDVSSDGQNWTTIRKVVGANALPSELMLPDLQTRYLRLAFAGATAPATVSKIGILETAVGASPNAFWKHRATRARKGVFPRNLLEEQSYWTVMGQPGDAREALMNEEGQIEVAARGVSLEPFVLRGDQLLTWADASHEQSLRDGWIPIPTVVRTYNGLELRVTAFAAGAAGASNLHAAYVLQNTSPDVVEGRMIVAVRPLQVLPPWQDLNITGGWTAIRSIRVEDGSIVVNDDKDAKRIVPGAGYELTLSPYDAGDPIEQLKSGSAPLVASGEKSIIDPQKSATALIHWAYELQPGESKTFLAAVPFHGTEVPAELPADAAAFAELQNTVAADWSKQVNRATFKLPPAAKQFHDTIRATQAYILINHDGNGFQPGSRTYDRSWMRDGSMTSAAMLELGHEQLVKDFVNWIAPYQFPSGKVPCVVDRRGPDPVPEHDSHGQLIWLIANTYRYTHDEAIVRNHFPRVRKAVEYIESLRAERMTEEFGLSGPPRQEPGKPAVPAAAFRGLVPESISHEGYSAKPMHSFWDTFFILRGLNDAAYLAEVAGEPALSAKWKSLTEEFRESLRASIHATHAAHGIDYLPGCVELGDFDSTSSTILLWPVDEAESFPRAWLDATFDRAWKEFLKRRESMPATWTAYTPYEIRHVGTYLRLGHKDRAWAAMDYFFAHQRPVGWRHWAEVVWRDPLAPKMIGDMPHTWVGSDFLNAMRAMFVYEDQHQQKLILLAGLPDAWLTDPAGVSFANLRTEYGTISATAKNAAAGKLVVTVKGSSNPPGGIELRSPLSGTILSAAVNGEPAVVADNGVLITRLPAEVVLEYGRK
ncbi:MAG TPA: discoidin domain-containing protein [Tepidisphaeraceae bacterium]|nr:discoidin domain-containing protein [Tepidisphaeraceae bacterium]